METACRTVFVACALRDPSAPGTDGLDVLRDAGVQVEGTAQWGAAFVCRVEGRPASSETILVPDVGALQETCDRTPSALAYWTLWTAAPGGAWTYAQTGAGDMDLVPGAALGLVFAVGEDGPEPPSLSAGAARTGTATDGWTWRASSADDATSSGSEDAEGRRSRTSADTVLPVVGATLVVVLVLASLALARRRR